MIVKEGDLLPANSLYTTTMTASVIVGFAVGEPLLALADRVMLTLGITHNGPAILVGVSYFLAGVCLVTLTPGPEALSSGRDWSQLWLDIRDGLRYLKYQVQVRVAILQLVLLSCVFAALAVLAVRLAELIPTLKASQFGFCWQRGCRFGPRRYFGWPFWPAFPQALPQPVGHPRDGRLSGGFSLDNPAALAVPGAAGAAGVFWGIGGYSHANPNSRENTRRYARQGVWATKQFG